MIFCTKQEFPQKALNITFIYKTGWQFVWPGNNSLTDFYSFLECIYDLTGNNFLRIAYILHR